MMKKILPTMVGLALVGGMTAAIADVTVFGHIDTDISRTDTDEDFINMSKMPSDWSPTTAAASGNDWKLGCTTCSIGFKGSEDLGNGLKAIFSLDFQYDTTKVSSLTDRDQWLGLSGNFGQVRMGTISTVYKSHGAMIDPLYRTALQGRGLGLQSFLHSNAGEEGEGRATNTIRYDSPDFSGFKLGGTYTMDSNKTPESDDPFGIGGSYENGGILVFADYLTNSGGNSNPNGDLSAWKIGGKYSFNDFAVLGQYEDMSDDNTGGGDLTMWHLAGSYTMGSNLIYAAYGQGTIEESGSPDVDTDSWTIAAVHSMSKSTSVYAGYNAQSEDLPGNSVDADKFSLGMKLKF